MEYEEQTRMKWKKAKDEEEGSEKRGEQLRLVKREGWREGNRGAGNWKTERKKDSERKIVRMRGVKEFGLVWEVVMACLGRSLHSSLHSLAGGRVSIHPPIGHLGSQTPVCQARVPVSRDSQVQGQLRHDGQGGRETREVANLWTWCCITGIHIARPEWDFVPRPAGKRGNGNDAFYPAIDVTSLITGQRGLGHKGSVEKWVCCALIWWLISYNRGAREPITAR